LVLFALVTGVVFAASRGELNGVTWAQIQDSRNSTVYVTEIYNDNNYPVKVDISSNSGSSVIYRDMKFAAKETKRWEARLTVTKVTK